MITWLHLSDWHQHGNEFDRKVVRDALVRDIKTRVSINPNLANLDFFFFTGDLANFGIEAEYNAAQTEFLEPVRKATGVPIERGFIIPGNHDIDRGSFELLPAGLLEPLADDAAAQKWLTAGKMRDRLLSTFEAYDKFVAGYGAKGFVSFGGSCTIDVRGTNVGIVGCNSALMCGRNKQKEG